MLTWLLQFFNIKRLSLIDDETDARNYNSSTIAGQIQRSDLIADDFMNFDVVQKIDQQYTDFCVACGEAYSKQAQNGIEMSWNGAFALCMKSIGVITTFGTSILQMKKAAQSYGVPERSLWPFQSAKGRQWNADWNNLPVRVLNNALSHKDFAYYEVDVPWGWDEFDSWRAHLWKFKDQHIVIQTAIDKHNVTLVGQKTINGEIKLVGIDSYGDQSIPYRVGKSINGYRYFSRREANLLCTGYFSINMDKNLGSLLNQYNEKAVKVATSPDCFIVRNGQRHSLVNEYIALANNCLMYDPNNVYTITQAEMDVIPLGAPVKFKDGINWPIIQRILELQGQNQLLTQLDN